MYIKLFSLFIIFIIIDMIVIFPNKHQWINLSTYCKKQKLRVVYGIFAWMLLSIGLYSFVIPHIGSYYDCFRYGILYATIVYGVFDFTNMVLFSFYPWWLTLLDILSGCITCILTLCIYNKIFIK